MEREHYFFNSEQLYGVELDKRLNIHERCDKNNLNFTYAERVQIMNLSKRRTLYQFFKWSTYDYSTCYGPRKVLKTESANCFEAACLANTVLFLNGIRSYIVLLEFTSSMDHNVLIYQNPKTKLWGYFDSLGGRKPQYTSWNDPFLLLSKKQPRMTGYSEPINLVKKFGTKWMKENNLWDMYYLYIDSNVKFYPTERYNRTHRYQAIKALQNKWIEVHKKKPTVVWSHFPKKAQDLFQYDELPIPDYRNRGLTRKEWEFISLTGGTPNDFFDHASDLRDFLRAGYSIRQIVPKSKA